MMIITVLSKILGFFRDITLTYFYGASATTDAYFISISIITVLFSLLITGVVSGYIPLYEQIENEKGEQLAENFTNNLVNIVLLVTTVLVFLGLFFSKQLVTLFAYGFDEETKKTAILFTRIGLAGVYFTSLTQLFSSYLHVKGKYVITTMIGFPYNLLIILAIVISAYTNNLLLVIGSVIASFVQLLFLIPSLYKSRFRYKTIIRFADGHIKKMAFFVLPITVGMSVDHINTIVDKTLASRIVEGGISALTYASRLNDFVHGIFVISFITVLFPFLSKMAVQKSDEALKRSIREVLSSVILLVVPASVGLMVLAEQIIHLLFGRGQFDRQAVALTSQALFYYSIGMIGYGIREILLRTFYSLQDMKTPMVNASIAVLLNIVLNLILSVYMGIGGLALATSLSALFSTSLLFFGLQRKIGALGLKRVGITLLKVICASGGMGITIHLFNVFVWGEVTILLRVIGCVMVGSFVYFILIILLKVEETKIIMHFLREKVRF